jgi:hypothetical protein
MNIGPNVDNTTLDLACLCLWKIAEQIFDYNLAPLTEEDRVLALNAAFMIRHVDLVYEDGGKLKMGFLVPQTSNRNTHFLRRYRDPFLAQTEHNKNPA